MSESQKWDLLIPINLLREVMWVFKSGENRFECYLRRPRKRWRKLGMGRITNDVNASAT